MLLLPAPFAPLMLAGIQLLGELNGPTKVAPVDIGRGTG